MRRGRGLFSLLAVVGIALGTSSAGCGGNEQLIVDGPARKVADEWPPVVAEAPADAASIRTVLGAADGTQVHVRGYLVAIKVPCPACNTNLGARPNANAPREEAIGRARTPVAAPGPGCEPCPPQAATLSDEPPKASVLHDAPPLRAVGAAEALQPRHIGHQFLLTGTFHAQGPQGPELEVTEVRALPDQVIPK